MSQPLAVSVRNVSKDFVLPHQRADTLKSLFAHPFRKRTKIEAQHALQDVSFDIKQGEFFGIVGRNGSGKSTLLKLIARIYQPTKGEIMVNGRLVPFIELGVGFNPELTGRENVFLNGALMGFSRKEISAKYDEIVEFAELERFMDQKLKNYSSGMQVRLAFSVATKLAESDILLIDEVLAVGDADFQRKCFDYFRNLKNNKKTVVFVSHDMEAVVEFCDRAILIDNSKLIKEGKPEKVAEAYHKLFKDAHEKVNKEVPKRWGDESITLGKPTITPKALSNKDAHITLSMSAQIKADVEKPLIGFSVKNSLNEIILGTNNAITQQPLETGQKGESVTMEWKIPNIFSEGRHSIDLAAEYQDGAVVADRWENVLTFEVTNKEDTPYKISPSVGLKLQTKAGKK